MIAANGWYAECDHCDALSEVAESPQSAVAEALAASWEWAGSELLCPPCWVQHSPP